VLSASPDSNLRDGQSITVTGTGYPTNASLDLVECVQDQGCDFGELQVLFSGTTGGYTTTFIARRILNLDGVQIDCAVAQNCILVSLDISDLSTGAQTSITFDPNSPIKPPLHFLMAPDPVAAVRVDKGVARVTGTAQCNQPVSIGADMMLEQIYQRQIFRSEAFVIIDCAHDARFAVVFRPVNGLFGEGSAKLYINASGSTTTNYFLNKHVTLTLQSTP
jgi:Neocarzinostatin family